MKYDKWIQYIVEMGKIKEQLVKKDNSGVHKFYFPEVKATNDEINFAETLLGVELDKSYKEFLKRANGWKGIMLNINIFGTNELIDNNIQNKAFEFLKIIEEDVLIPNFSCKAHDLIPIAMTFTDKDIFVMSKSSSNMYGKVIWLAGEVVDIFNNFEEFFLSIIEYNKQDLTDLDCL